MSFDTARIQQLMEPVHDAHGLARRLVDELGEKGDPQAGQATMVFQRLTAIEISLFDLRSPPDVSEIATTLEALAEECDGALRELRPLLERAGAAAAD